MIIMIIIIISLSASQSHNRLFFVGPLCRWTLFLPHILFECGRSIHSCIACLVYASLVKQYPVLASVL